MDSFRQAMLLGLGAISVTKEKAEEIIDVLVKLGEIEMKDRAATVEQLLKEAERRKSELEGKVSASVRKVMTEAGLPTQKDLKTILKRLDDMEKAISKPRSRRRGKKI